MAASGEDEFTNFLEFGMHFPDLEGHGPGERQLQPPRSLPASASMMPTTTAEQEQLIRMDTADSAREQPQPIFCVAEM